MSNLKTQIKELKAELTKSRSRHKAAGKAFDKATDSQDEMLQIKYEDKLCIEQSIIDDLSDQIKVLEYKISNKQEQEQELEEDEPEIEELTSVEESHIDETIEETESIVMEEQAQTTELLPATVHVRTSYNTKSGDWPQLSFRVPPEQYESLKAHIKEVSMFENMADMSRTLCMGDYNNSVVSVFMNHFMDQLSRFIETNDHWNEASESDVVNVTTEYNNLGAVTKEQRHELLKDLKSIRAFITSKELHRFQNQ